MSQTMGWPKAHLGANVVYTFAITIKVAIITRIKAQALSGWLGKRAGRRCRCGLLDHCCRNHCTPAPWTGLCMARR